MGQQVLEEAHCVCPDFIKFYIKIGNVYFLLHSLHSLLYCMYVRVQKNLC
jgi:hypothetical protein